RGRARGRAARGPGRGRRPRNGGDAVVGSRDAERKRSGARWILIPPGRAPLRWRSASRLPEDSLWEVLMRIHVLAIAIGVALLLAAVSAGQEQDTIKVDLKSFKFKVTDDFANLFGYNEDEGKLFFYTNGPAR